MNRYAVLSEGFEHLSYHFGREDAADSQEFSERGETYLLNRAESEVSCRMALGATDALTDHASLPVGFVSAENGHVYLVSQLSGKRMDPSSLSSGEKREFCSAVIRRLASLHTSGLGCGGITPDSVDFSGKDAKMANASRIYLLEESDTTFFEAVSTLRALAGGGYAKRSELPSLAAEYISSSPVCREGVLGYMRKKGMASPPHSAVADLALKYCRYL